MKKQKTDLITLGITFYEKTNSKYLCESIDSILEQTIIPKIIHLIQDGEISRQDLLRKVLSWVQD